MFVWRGHKIFLYVCTNICALKVCAHRIADACFCMLASSCCNYNSVLTIHFGFHQLSFLPTIVCTSDSAVQLVSCNILV
jgi:hypothetical protein